MYELKQKQFLQASADDVWKFISHPANLNEITPDELDFSIISEVPEIMYNGLLVQYKVKLPFLGTSDWVTEIKHIIPGQQFVDEQRIGPYAFWYHHHGLEETKGGVLMTDHVRYLPPYGVIGKAFNYLLIENKLAEIFAYRKSMLDERYNN